MKLYFWTDFDHWLIVTSFTIFFISAANISLKYNGPYVMPADTAKPTNDFDLDLLIQNYQFPKSYWVWPPEWESSSSVYT